MEEIEFPWRNLSSDAKDDVLDEIATSDSDSYFDNFGRYD